MEQLAEQVGLFMKYWGFKEIHGRIWSHLYVSKEPLDANALICKIGVSKALISLSLKDLLQYSVVEEKGKSPSGTLLYAANPDVTSVILNVLRCREKKMLGLAEAAQKMVSELSDREKELYKIDPDRLKSLGQMIQEARSTLESILDLAEVDFSHWRDLSS